MTEKQLILVVCLSRAGEATLKHPLMVRLEQQVSNLDKFIRTPKIDEEKLLDVRVVDREEAAAEIQFDHASKLQWPDHLSPTSIATPKEIAERLKEYDAVYKELVDAIKPIMVSKYLAASVFVIPAFSANAAIIFVLFILCNSIKFMMQIYSFSVK